MGRVFAGRYEIGACLGEGITGRVYRAHDLQQQAPVAIKILHARHQPGSDAAQRFRREAQAAARLAHPNCVHVIDSGTADGNDFLVMPLLDGRELRDAMRGPLAVDQAIDLILQILRGLEHAHGRGLVHRDVKPENVLLETGPDGHPCARLVDFGLVKVLEREPGAPALTKTGLVFGTPYYMSPEQASGVPADPRADLYSVGVVMFEMLTGEPPFDGPNAIAVIRKHVFVDPPPLPASVPPAVAAVIMRLLAKEPRDRFGSATEAIAALESASGIVRESSARIERRWSMRPVAPRRPPETLLRRGHGVFGVVAGFGVLLGALLAGWIVEPSPRVATAAIEDFAVGGATFVPDRVATAAPDVQPLVLAKARRAAPRAAQARVIPTPTARPTTRPTTPTTRPRTTPRPTTTPPTTPPLGTKASKLPGNVERSSTLRRDRSGKTVLGPRA